MLTRRTLLSSVAPAAVAISVAGCWPTPTPTTIPTWVAGLQAIATEIALVIPELQVVGLGGNTLTSAQAIVTEIQTALAAISATSTTTQGQSVLIQVEGYINALAPLILPFVSLIPGGTTIGIIIAALPALEALVNIAVSLLSAQAASIASTAPPLPAAAKVGAALTPAEQYLQWLITQANKGK